MFSLSLKKKWEFNSAQSYFHHFNLLFSLLQSCRLYHRVLVYDNAKSSQSWDTLRTEFLQISIFGIKKTKKEERFSRKYFFRFTRYVARIKFTKIEIIQQFHWSREICAMSLNLMKIWKNFESTFFSVRFTRNGSCFSMTGNSGPIGVELLFHPENTIRRNFWRQHAGRCAFRSFSFPHAALVLELKGNCQTLIGHSFREAERMIRWNDRYSLLYTRTG